MMTYILVSYMTYTIVWIASYICALTWFHDAYHAADKKKASIFTKKVLRAGLLLPVGPLVLPLAVCYLVFLGAKWLTQKTITTVKYADNN